MRATLTPNTGEAPKVFEVGAVEYNAMNGELTLACRDGKVCLGLIGGWTLSIVPSRLGVTQMGCEDVERVHDGRSLLVI